MVMERFWGDGDVDRVVWIRDGIEMPWKDEDEWSGNGVLVSFDEREDVRVVAMVVMVFLWFFLF